MTPEAATKILIELTRATDLGMQIAVADLTDYKVAITLRNASPGCVSHTGRIKQAGTEHLLFATDDMISGQARPEILLVPYHAIMSVSIKGAAQ